MKKFIVIVLLSLFSYSAYAEDAAHKEKKKHHKNKEKVEQKEELKRPDFKPMSFVDRMMLLDRNKDGSLSREELENFKPPVMKMPMFGHRSFGMPPRR